MAELKAMDTYVVKKGTVESDVIDDEGVVINLESGKYYCLNATATEAWQLLAEGASAASITANLESRYEASDNRIAESVESFVSELSAEGLIEPTDATPVGFKTARVDGTKAAFAPPNLEIFSDMQEFLLVDPVHEIDETGLPDMPVE